MGVEDKPALDMYQPVYCSFYVVIISGEFKSIIQHAAVAVLIQSCNIV